MRSDVFQQVLHGRHELERREFRRLKERRLLGAIDESMNASFKSMAAVLGSSRSCRAISAATQLPRGSIYTTIMELGPQNHNGDGLLGPNSIIVVYMDPLGYNTLSPAGVDHFASRCASAGSCAGQRILHFHAYSMYACRYLATLTCDPKPYRIVGYDPLTRGSNCCFWILR